MEIAIPVDRLGRGRNQSGKMVTECTGIVHDTINTVINCERGFGCYYPRSGIKSSAYTGRTIYMKNHISDPLARLTITVIANDNLGWSLL